MSALRHWNFRPCGVRRRCAIRQDCIFNDTDENFNNTNRRACNSHILLLSLRKSHVMYNIRERKRKGEHTYVLYRIYFDDK